MNSWTLTRIRNKKTREIGILSRTICGQVIDPEGSIWYTSIEIIWGGFRKETFYGSLEANLDSLEVIDHDFSEITPNIMKLLKTEEYRGIIESVARRLDPGYFEEGVLVYFNSAEYIIEKYSNNINLYGPKYPYLIAKITDTSHEAFLNDYIISFELTLIPYSKRISELTLKEIQKNLNNYKCIDVTGYRSSWKFQNDAYNLLSRYDKEY